MVSSIHWSLGTYYLWIRGDYCTNYQHKKEYILVREYVHHQDIRDQRRMLSLQEGFELRSDIADLRWKRTTLIHCKRARVEAGDQLACTTVRY